MTREFVKGKKKLKVETYFDGIKGCGVAKFYLSKKGEYMDHPNKILVTEGMPVEKVD